MDISRTGDLPLPEEGGPALALSASYMSELVRRVNVLMRMQGVNGIHVHHADGNVVIDGAGLQQRTGIDGQDLSQADVDQ